MNIKTMLQPASRIAYKIYGKVQKHAPELLLGSGLVSMAAGTIVACERTTKAEDILDETRQRLDKVREAEARKDELNYTERDKRRDLAIIYGQTGLKFAKLYWPAAALECLGIACVLGSYGIMRSRNVALTAAYTALETSYSQYRRRVREKLGDDEDAYFRTGLASKMIEVTEKDENGNEKVVRTEQKVFDPDNAGVSTFARWFDETNPEFSKSPMNNLTFLMAQQKHANYLLKSRGYVFLNDVYDMLSIPRCPQGQAVGWLKDENNGGSGFVDFGIHDGYRQMCRDFVNGYEKAILLDFNIDPTPIWNKI